jgi:hypothetical protein
MNDKKLQTLVIVAGWLVVAPCAGLRAADVLVQSGSTWAYLDNGSDQGTAWRAPGFPGAASWLTGPAQLGYGDGDEATVVGYGPNAAAKHITTYFRHAFNVGDPGIYTSLLLRVLRDDGVVVYLNGVEVFRDNMPGGGITYQTLASTALGAPAESTFLETSIGTANLVGGQNVLAVEIHQAIGSSSDASFDLQLVGSDSAGLILRGPYLQMRAPNSMVVRWRTDVPSDSRVRFGTDPASLTGFAADPVLTTEHIVNVTGLAGSRNRRSDSSGASGLLPSRLFRSPPSKNSITR